MSSFNITEVAALIASLAPACREAGVRRIKVGDVELEFSAPTSADPKEIARIDEAMKASQLPEEDMLYFSAPGYVLTADRADTTAAPLDPDPQGT